MSESINQTGLVRFKITNPNASAPVARFRGSATFPIKSYYNFTVHPGSHQQINLGFDILLDDSTLIPVIIGCYPTLLVTNGYIDATSPDGVIIDIVNIGTRTITVKAGEIFCRMLFSQILEDPTFIVQNDRSVKRVCFRNNQTPQQSDEDTSSTISAGLDNTFTT